MTHLEIGDKAPLFSAFNQDNKMVNLTDFSGKKIVIYFYPKDDTPGCTAEACNIRDNYHSFIKRGYVVLGVSVDSVKSHKKFTEKYQLPFDLLADTEKSIVESYGVWGEKKMYGRSYFGTKRETFIIDEKGFIEDIIRQVDTKNHTSQILK